MRTHNKSSEKKKTISLNLLLFFLDFPLPPPRCSPRGNGRSAYGRPPRVIEISKMSVAYFMIFYNVLICVFFPTHPRGWIIQISISGIDSHWEFASHAAKYLMVLVQPRVRMYWLCIKYASHRTRRLAESARDWIQITRIFVPRGDLIISTTGARAVLFTVFTRTRRWKEKTNHFGGVYTTLLCSNKKKTRASIWWLIFFSVFFVSALTFCSEHRRRISVQRCHRWSFLVKKTHDYASGLSFANDLSKKTNSTPISLLL